jgi:type II secretory pathway component GspD/PulD (secretin)
MRPLVSRCAALALLCAAPALAAPAAPGGTEVSTGTLDALVTVRVKDAPLSEFLDAVAAQSKLSFVLADGLEKKRVTAFLRNLTARDALEVLRATQGLTYRQVGKSGTFVIARSSGQAQRMITRIYQPTFLPVAGDDGTDPRTSR